MTTPKRLETNVSGNFYVNSACIDCDTCRQLAPAIFSEVGGYSAVTQQPTTHEEERQAFQALLACPTAAIMSEQKEGLQAAVGDFPLHLHNDIYYMGYTSRKSYGGSSYLIVHPDGNWLIDSPRYLHTLADKITALGGIRYIFLTHSDDVADADRYAAHFKAERIIHSLERHAQPDAEHFIEGFEPIEWTPDFRLLPTPGHTQGHTCLLYQQRFLFTGDHLAWDRERDGLKAFKDYCWHSWDQQIESLHRLAAEEFDWILPGHGQRVHLPLPEMKQAMQRLLGEIR